MWAVYSLWSLRVGLLWVQPRKRGSKEYQKRQCWFFWRLLGPADSYPQTHYVCDLKGTPSRENRDYFADVQVFFVRTKALCSVFSPNMCCLLGSDDWEHMPSVSCSEDCVGAKGGDTDKWGKDSISPKQSAPVICICVRIKGHTGLLQKSCFWWDLGGHTNIAPPMKISLKPSACFIPLQLKSLCSALCEQQFHSFWPFLHGWGEWIRQRNHYRFKSHSLTKSRLLVLALSPQRTREWFPLSVNSCPEGGRGPGAKGMGGEGLKVREPYRGLEWEGPAHRSPQRCFPSSAFSLEHWIMSICHVGEGEGSRYHYAWKLSPKMAFLLQIWVGQVWNSGVQYLLFDSYLPVPFLPTPSEKSVYEELETCPGLGTSAWKMWLCDPRVTVGALPGRNVSLGHWVLVR